MLRKHSLKGFTLVELMIVVAIIGILAAIAIPNYQKYQAKARTVEAKIVLSSMYTVEKTYATEYSTYTTCVASAGYAPDGYTGADAPNNKNYYTHGFNAQNIASPPLASNAPPCSTACTKGACAAVVAAAGAPAGEGSTYFTAANKVGTTASTAADLTVAVGKIIPAVPAIDPAAGTTFAIAAAGYISSGGDEDRWTIDQNKTITEVTVGF